MAALRSMDGVTCGQFEPLLGSRFELQVAPGETVTATLVEAQSVGMPVAGMRQPFALLFRGPTAPVLPQRIYGMTHDADAVPAMELFIVPVRSSRDGTYYEAVFA